jgi:predicted DNA-binding protein (MmcQ/YjbR family)
MSNPASPAVLKRIRQRLLTLALTLPGAYEDDPWQECVVKVDKKIFVFLGTGHGEHGPGFGVKLRSSHEEARGAEGVSPMGYRLGQSGWVWITLAAADVPAEVFEDWIEESYRCVALKRRVAELDRRTEG